MKQIINCETGQIIERELNTSELKQAEIDAKASIEQKQMAATQSVAKQAVLQKLGLTSEEAKLLLS
jgi:hypothetical protein